MGGKIEVYLDVVSPYSYFAFLHLMRNRDVLESHGVELDIIPVFLGGINAGSGNKPPWTLPAKASYSTHDIQRAKQYFHVPDMRIPPFFPINSLLPQRILTHVKHHHAPSTFISLLHTLYKALFHQGVDISVPSILTPLLEQHLPAADIPRILAAAEEEETKQRLKHATQEALDRGAFGLPWLWVAPPGEDGRPAEPFFGSDRWHHLWPFLGLPWRDVEILPPTGIPKL